VSAATESTIAARIFAAEPNADLSWGIDYLGINRLNFATSTNSGRHWQSNFYGIFIGQEPAKRALTIRRPGKRAMKGGS
jgi:hypothetical protein